MLKALKARDRCVVVSKDGDLGDVPDDVRAFVRAPAVPDDVPETVVRIDILAAIGFHDGGHRL